MAQAFADGGPFMFVILLLGIALTALTIVAFVRHKKSDWSPMLWGMLVALLLLGWMGTVMGMIQGFDALAYAAPDQRASLMAQMVAIAINTIALAVIMAFPLSIMIGVASFLAKRAWRRQQAA